MNWQNMLVLVSVLSQSVTAQTPSTPLRASRASVDPVTSSSGSYRLDPRHTSIIARLAHNGGTSLSTFRFGKTTGTLDWNASDPTASKTAITVDMTSLETPVPGFAAELIGERFLKTGQFHDAMFTSSKITRSGPATGRVSGNLTFMGQTKPVVVDARLMGHANGRSGPTVGFSGTMHFKRSDFGFSTMTGPIGDEVEILIDLEFIKDS